MNALVHSRTWLLLGWSMIHFLWVGAAMLVAAGTLRLLLRRAAPNVRYAMAVATLLLLVAAPVLVAVRLAPRSLADPDVASLDASRAIVDVPIQSALATNDAGRPFSASQPLAAKPTEPPLDLAAIESLARRAGRIGAAYLPWLWLAGFPVTALYLLAGISGTGRLRRRARLVIDPNLMATLDRLAAELGVRGQIVIGLSAQVVAPLVVGIARPMILLPPVLLACWSPEELELILLHELAHVRRWDNFVNLFQRIAEAMLFFHPAVWIVSRWVRLEREQCCDEIVLRHRDAPQKYAETLAALAVPGISPVHAAAAMANHQLVARIRNILNVEDRTMRFSARSLLVAVGSVALLAGLIFVAGPLAADEQPPANPAAPSPAGAKTPIDIGASAAVAGNNGDKFKVAEVRDITVPVDVLWSVKEDSRATAANGQKRSWGPEQACGAPDTLQPGDFPTAWASASPDGQREWLEVGFGEQIDGVALVVYENNAPGAVDKLVLLDAGGNVIEVRGVKDPTPTSAPAGVSIFPLVGSMHGVRVELDSANVPGWNEIDAVGLLDKQGQVHWAKTAKASSTFADVDGTAQGSQWQVLRAGDRARFSPFVFTLTGETEQEFANDPEVMRLRKSIEEIDQAVRGTAVTGDDSQQELAKKRLHRAEVRKGLLNEELEDRMALLRRERTEAAAQQRAQAEKLERDTRVAAQRAAAAEEQARANAAKADADRAQAQAQLKAALDANRKLEYELAIFQHQTADAKTRKAVVEHVDCATCHTTEHKAAAAPQALNDQALYRWQRSKLDDAKQKLGTEQTVTRFDARTLANARQSLGFVADKLVAELKELDRQAQGASNSGRAQIAERMQKLHDQLDGIQATLQQLDKSLQEETTHAILLGDQLQTKSPTPPSGDRAALERIEQLEKAVQDLRRAQQNKPDAGPLPGSGALDPHFLPGQPR